MAAYRKGNSYFYICTVRKYWSPTSYSEMNRRGTLVPNKDLTAIDVAEWVIAETIAGCDYKHLKNDEVALAFYHIEPN